MLENNRQSYLCISGTLPAPWSGGNAKYLEKIAETLEKPNFFRLAIFLILAVVTSCITRDGQTNLGTIAIRKLATVANFFFYFLLFLEKGNIVMLQLLVLNFFSQYLFL